MAPQISKIPSIVGERYRLTKQLAVGGHGEVHQAVDTATGEEVAVKLESCDLRGKTLKNENSVYSQLQNVPLIPKVRFYCEADDYSALVLDLLGPSLEVMFHRCGGRFSLKTVLMLADQLLQRLEVLHSKNFLHRDVKPGNFVFGLGENRDKIYLIDFGLAKYFRCLVTHEHIAFAENKRFIGTTKYSSLNAERRFELGRRDDMESLGYVFVNFLKGKLPWQGVQASNRKQKHEKIQEIKMATSLTQLCEELPSEFVKYLQYCRDLKFDEAPDYQLWRTSFRALFNQCGFQDDGKYDWQV